MSVNTHGSHFGPPSQLIDVAQFIQSTLSCTHSVSDTEAWLQLSEDQRNAVAIECKCVHASVYDTSLSLMSEK
jgi:hypothetical protein